MQDAGGAKGAGRPGRGYVIWDSRDELALASSRYSGSVRRGRHTSRDTERGAALSYDPVALNNLNVERFVFLAPQYIERVLKIERRL